MFRAEIHIKNSLNMNWSDWFEDMQIRTSAEGNSILYGCLPDQSALYGVLSRLSSLGITLVSVDCYEEKGPGPP